MLVLLLMLNLPTTSLPPSAPGIEISLPASRCEFTIPDEE
jgi:hypothetical protein